MKNFGSTCWFNSVVQFLFHSNISYKIIEHINNASLYILDPDDNNLTLQYLVDIWNFMRSSKGQGKSIPEKLLLRSLRKICCVIPGFSINVQQDAFEFNNYIINEVAQNIDNQIIMTYTNCCLNCGKLHTKDVN